MYCSQCGAECPDTAKFCTNCGQPLQGASTQKTEKPKTESSEVYMDFSEVTDPMDEVWEAREIQKRNRLAGATLTLGILGMIFSLFCLGPVGFVLSIIAKSKAGQYLRTYGEEEARVRSGRKMANVGFVLGLILTIPFVIFLVVGFWYSFLDVMI